MNGRVDLRVACPGGIIGTGALRTVAELSGAWGIDRLTIGHRQDLLVAGIPDSYVARFRAAVAPLDVDRADASGHPNITSSAAATGIMRGARWLDAGIIQSILAGIRLRPSFAVNVADPHQDLLPLTSGLVNFLAADEVDSWRIAIAADHHPRRGARAPGRYDRVTLPYLVPSEYVAEAVQAAEETVVDAGAESSHLSEDLAHAIRDRLGTRLVRADAGQRLPPPEYRFLLYCRRRVPQLRQSLPLLVLLVVTKAPQKLADRRRVRYPVAPQHSLQCVILAQPVDILQPAPATDHAVDQGQDMIRLPVPLAASQHPYSSVDCARHSEPLDQLAHQHQT